jgi:UDPglucose--hexose-1-phosphate uridylyltransferase
MSLFRKDPFGVAWVLISPERGLQASEYGNTLQRAVTSPLSPGNEAAVGPEIQALRPSASAIDSPDWRMRVIEHPSALVQGRPFSIGGDELFVQGPASGYQEIVVEHPDARVRLDTMTPNHLTEVLKLYRERLVHLAQRPAIRHVQLTRNVGRAAGALFEHPHGQLLAVPVPNRWVEEEVAAAGEHHTTTGRCLFCDVIAEELLRRERIVSHNAGFVAVAPYAAKTPFETWILPRRHDSAFTAVASNTLAQLGELLQGVVRALNAALDHPPFNLVLHTLPHAGESGYHWHIEILPRLTDHAGFDWGTGFYVNPTPPEDAARFLREALALQEVAL